MNRFLLFPAIAAACIHPASAAIVFSDDFTTLTGSGSVRQLGDGGWAGYIGNASTAATAPSGTEGTHRAGTVNGTNGDLTNYVFAQNQANAPAGMNYFIYTTAHVTAFAPADYTAGLTASWNRNGNGFASGGGYYLSVQVGGNWYASQTNSGTGTAPSLDLLTTTWVNLVIDTTPETGSLTLGSTVSSHADLFGSGQQITGIGFFVDNLVVGTGAGSSRTIRIDNIVIEGVPEVSSSLLALCGAVPLLASRRRYTVAKGSP